MSQLKDAKEALAVINYCLYTEDKDFWQWVDEMNVSERDVANLSGAVGNHVYAAALKAVGVTNPERNNLSRYVGDSIVDPESAIAVCEYYVSDKEADDFRSGIDENGWTIDNIMAGDHVYAGACRALGLESYITRCFE